MVVDKILNDRSVCDYCLNEIIKIKEKRYFYPFVGCSECGSFFSTLHFDSNPYFNICHSCRNEYMDSSHRRYNYPFVCCSDCGPKVFLLDNQGQVFTFDNYRELFKNVSDYIINCEVLVFKTSNIFYFICDAINDESVSNLRKIKKTFKSLPVMFKNRQMFENYVRTDEKVDFVKDFDIKIVRCYESRLSSSIGITDYIAFSIACDPFFVLLFEFLDRPIVYSSVNISSESPYISNDEVVSKFSKDINHFVMNDLEIKTVQDYSIVYNSIGVCIRRGIGRVGKVIETNYSFKDCVCLGPELESSVCSSTNNKVFLSTRLGHLINEHVFKNYEKIVSNIISGFVPEVIVCDLHPYYLSTELAKNISENMKIELRQVQHHKAHIYSLIIDKGIEGNVIGFSFDGTGYGEDGNIWGGEVFIGDLYNLERVAHFKYIPIVAGDSAIENAVLIALSFVARYIPEKMDLFNQVAKLQRDIISKQIQTNTNVYHTSSVGRLFDIAAVLLKIRQDSKIAFSGQAAIELEKLAHGSTVSDHLPFEVYENENVLNIDLLECFRYIIERREFETYSDIARKFHNTIVEAMFSVATKLRDKYGIEQVGFSGGVFQNKILCYQILKRFKDFKINFHRDIPPNDSGISLGQLQAALRN
ncbi:MAG: Sua5/YciO/YrdC/YwlC family protein [bacterium]|nr:Sua5/YciO/YrdC/YwlC family protein [bacterium]